MMSGFRTLFTFGAAASLAAVMSGCGGGDLARDNAALLDDAVDAAQAALSMELPELPGEVEAAGVRNGVPVVQYHAPEDAEAPYTGAYGYGAWLGERGFAVYSAPAAGIAGRTFMLADDADESEGAPGADAAFTGTWQGVMLGVDTTVTGDGGVQGDARVDLHSGMSGSSLDVTFSDVTGVNNDREYDGHRWTGVSVTGSSFDATSGDGGTIDGQFYGHHHENVMGDFTYDDLVGGWGAVRIPVGEGGADDGDSGDDGDMGGDDGDMGGDDGDMGGDDGDMGGDDGDMDG